MSVTGPLDLNTAAVELLVASVEALDTIPDFDAGLDGAPDRAFIAPGDPALDCCDQLTVNVAQILDAPTAGGLAAGRKVAASVNHVYFAVTITRCVHVPDGDGNPPTSDELEADAAQMNADAWVLWNHLQNLWRSGDLFTFCDEVFWDGLRPLGPSGGCGGWTLFIHISLDGYQEASSS
jgi:hypothetical protein